MNTKKMASITITHKKIIILTIEFEPKSVATKDTDHENIILNVMIIEFFSAKTVAICVSFFSEFFKTFFSVSAFILIFN